MTGRTISVTFQDCYSLGSTLSYLCRQGHQFSLERQIDQSPLAWMSSSWFSFAGFVWNKLSSQPPYSCLWQAVGFERVTLLSWTPKRLGIYNSEFQVTIAIGSAMELHLRYVTLHFSPCFCKTPVIMLTTTPFPFDWSCGGTSGGGVLTLQPSYRQPLQLSQLQVALFKLLCTTFPIFALQWPPPPPFLLNPLSWLLPSLPPASHLLAFVSK